MINNYLMMAMMAMIAESVNNNTTTPFDNLINAIGEACKEEGRETYPAERDMMHFGGIALGRLMEEKRQTPTMDEAMAGAMLMEMLSKWGK